MSKNPQTSIKPFPFLKGHQTPLDYALQQIVAHPISILKVIIYIPVFNGNVFPFFHPLHSSP